MTFTDKEEALEVLWQAAAEMCYGRQKINEQKLVEFLDELTEGLGAFLSREEVEKAAKECFTHMLETAVLLSSLDSAIVKDKSGLQAVSSTRIVLKNSQRLLRVWDEYVV